MKSKSVFTSLFLLTSGTLFAQEAIKTSRWSVGANLAYLSESKTEIIDQHLGVWPAAYDYREKSHAPMFSLFINRSLGKTQKWNVELGIGYAIQFLSGYYDYKKDIVPERFSEKIEIWQPYIAVRYLFLQSSNTLWKHYAGLRFSTNMDTDESLYYFYGNFPSLGVEYMTKYTLSQNWNLQMGASYNYYDSKLEFKNNINPSWGNDNIYSHQFILSAGLAYRF